MKKIKLSYTQIIALGFLAIILLGTVLLCLPVSARSGTMTPIHDAFFTATSATCVTGLIVFDTFTHWSLFGQIVIITLIQIGGLGFMTVAILISMFLGRKIGLKERNLMQEAVNTSQIGGIVKMTRHIIFGTFFFEGVGAVLLAIRFCPEMGFAEGLYNAIFHSVSAFCNAGFDLMGKYEPFSSLTRYSGDWLVNLVIMSLIVIGGIGFFVWEDIINKKFHFHAYRLHTKIVLVTTGLLIVIPALLIFFMETTGGSLQDKGISESILTSLFQAITPRTAGFNTAIVPSLRDSTILLMMTLMIIGGSPGSTAGGIKTTTFAVLFISIGSTFKHSAHINAFRRRLEDGVLKRCCAILIIYITLMISAIMAICCIDNTPLKDTAFEVASAIGTVGISTGITPDLSMWSQFILSGLMYFGRVGCLTMIFAFADVKGTSPIQLPLEKISIG